MINETAQGCTPIEMVLGRLRDYKAYGDGYRAKCPAHDGQSDNSLSVKEGDDGCALLYCFSGCSFEEIVAALGLEPEDLFVRNDPKGPRPGWSKSKAKKGADKGTGDAGQTVRTEDLPGGTYWEFKALTGETLYIQRHKGPYYRRVGEDLWRGGKGALDGVTRVLYGLPELIEGVRAGKTVYHFEGPKDVETARKKLGVVATTSGGSNTWNARYAAFYTGADVVIVRDNDGPGREYAETVARDLFPVVRSIKVVLLPGLKEGGDVTDWLDDGHTREEFFAVIEEAADYSPSEGPEEEHREPSIPYNLTDMGNGERFAASHGADLRYVWKWQQWVAWDGTKWAPDETGEAERRAKATVKAMYHEADPGGGIPLDRNLAAHALKSEARPRIEAMLALARSERPIAVTPVVFDADRWALNVENGTVDLRTGELRPHRREDLITKIAGTVYDPEAEAPTWAAFLRRVLPSEALRRFVQKLAGYSLTGDVSEQILPFLFGLGANGKSTFINIFMEALGDYAQQAAPELLMAKANAHPTELADLQGTRLVAAVEIEDGRRLAESLVKQLTGGDKIRARKMRQDFFEFEPTHKPWLVANHRPEVRGTDHAMWRRIKLVPFGVTIPEEEKDPELPEKLRAELPGILAWAVEGCLLWQREGLGEPEEVKAATEDYRDEMDVLGEFIKDKCVLHENTHADATPLYQAYLRWCQNAGEEGDTQTKFGKRLRERGFMQDRDKKTRRKVWRGIGLWDPDSYDDDTAPRGDNSETVGGSETVGTDFTHNQQKFSHKDVNGEKGSNCFANDPTVSEDPPYAGIKPDVRAAFENPSRALQARLEEHRKGETILTRACALVSEMIFGTPVRLADVEPAIKAWLALQEGAAEYDEVL